MMKQRWISDQAKEDLFHQFEYLAEVRNKETAFRAKSIIKSTIEPIEKD